MSPTDANNSGGFFRSREEGDAAIRARSGDELADRVLRSIKLTRRPRRLTDSEEAMLRGAMAPILRDIGATGGILPVLVPEAHEDRGDDHVCAWITFGARDGTGIWVPVAGSAANQVFWLAEQMVDWECEKLADAGRSPAWPPCPDHPGRHPLLPDLDGDSAVWKCVVSARVVSKIGAFPAREGAHHLDPEHLPEFPSEDSAL
jgi:hypothetical protein